MTDDDSSQPRRRQPSPDLIVSREAARLVRDLNRQLGPWQSASVKVFTIAQRLRSANQTDPALVEEARRLLGELAAESRRLNDLLEQSGAAVVGHGRITDTRRSIDMVRERLVSSLRLLGEEPPAGTAG